MSLSVSCSECRKSYSVPEDFSGKKFKCRECGEIVLIPIRQRKSEADVPTKKSKTADALVAKDTTTQAMDDRKAATPSKGPIVPTPSRKPAPQKGGRTTSRLEAVDELDGSDEFEDYGEPIQPASPSNRRSNNSRKKSGRSKRSIWERVKSFGGVFSHNSKPKADSKPEKQKRPRSSMSGTVVTLLVLTLVNGGICGLALLGSLNMPKPEPLAVATSFIGLVFSALYFLFLVIPWRICWYALRGFLLLSMIGSGLPLAFLLFLLFHSGGIGPGAWRQVGELTIFFGVGVWIYAALGQEATRAYYGFED